MQGETDFYSGGGAVTASAAMPERDKTEPDMAEGEEI